MECKISYLPPGKILRENKLINYDQCFPPSELAALFSTYNSSNNEILLLIIPNKLHKIARLTHFPIILRKTLVMIIHIFHTAKIQLTVVGLSGKNWSAGPAVVAKTGPP